MWHYIFSIIHRRVIMMFRITRLSSERTVLDIDCFMHYTKHIQQDSNQVIGGKPGGGRILCKRLQR